MDTVPYTTARKYLVKTMEKVCDNHEPIILTRQNARSVVMMSLEDYNAIEETAYLLRSPANAKRLRESIEQYKHGKYKAKNLLKS